MRKIICPLLFLSCAISAQASTWGPDDDPGYVYNEETKRYEAIGNIWSADFWAQRNKSASQSSQKNTQQSDLFDKNPTLLETMKFQRQVIGEKGIENIGHSLQQTNTQIYWIMPATQTSNFSQGLLKDVKVLSPNVTLITEAAAGITSINAKVLSTVTIVLFGDDYWKETRTLYQTLMLSFDDIIQENALRTIKINLQDIPNINWKEIKASTTVELWKEASYKSTHYLSLICQMIHEDKSLSRYLGGQKEKYEYLLTMSGFEQMKNTLVLLEDSSAV